LSCQSIKKKKEEAGRSREQRKDKFVVCVVYALKREKEK
jgi:hypothetical protein